jgi:hypothetical protein
MRIIAYLLASACLSSIAQAKPSIQTHIISGGEVTIMEAGARYDRQGVTVSGTGLSLFPQETCGYAEIMFVDANGRTLLQKDALYKTFDWYPSSPRRSLMQDRKVSFSVNVPALTPTVTSVFVRHHSTGVCKDDWSFQSGLDLLIDKMIHQGNKHVEKEKFPSATMSVGSRILLHKQQQAT